MKNQKLESDLKVRLRFQRFDKCLVFSENNDLSVARLPGDPIGTPVGPRWDPVGTPLGLRWDPVGTPLGLPGAKGETVFLLGHPGTPLGLLGILRGPR